MMSDRYYLIQHPSKAEGIMPWYYGDDLRLIELLVGNGGGCGQTGSNPSWPFMKRGKEKEQATPP